MPTYSYKCEKCQKTFDKFQSMTEPPIEICIDDDCKGKVRRLIGMGAGAILKGSGFYQTDFKNSGKKEEKKAECKSCPSSSTCEKANWMFIDSAKIEVTSGDGGNGCFSYDRDKFKPKGKPGGGNGGRGGNVYVFANKKVQTLQDVSYRSFYKAERGGHGGSNNLYGKSGQDVKIPVPLGTTVKDFETDEFIYDFTTDGEEIMVAKGGRGGRGNKAMVTKFNPNPEHAEYGKEGETKTLKLTLKVMADVGLVGLPNAGKSTLLSVVSRATPEIADYPFTTLTPHLGIVKTGDFDSFVMADIPGIIEGASKGKGLGIQFLQHIERTRVLAILVDCNDEEPKETVKKLRKELKSYSGELAEKPYICILTKTDTKSSNDIKIPRGWFCISAATNSNVSKLTFKLSEMVDEARKNDETIEKEIVVAG